jgi:hypothetical protein
MDRLKALVEKKKKAVKQHVGDEKWEKRSEREQREREHEDAVRWSRTAVSARHSGEAPMRAPLHANCRCLFA